MIGQNCPRYVQRFVLDADGIVTDFLAQNIKEGIEGRPVSWYRDVFELVFPNLNREAANNVWKDKLKRTKRVSKSLKDAEAPYDKDSEEEYEDDQDNKMI